MKWARDTEILIEQGHFTQSYVQLKIISEIQLTTIELKSFH